MRRSKKRNEQPISEPLSVTLESGEVVNGTLWIPSGGFDFEVEYRGIRKTDGRINYYTNIGHLRAIAKIILRELAQDHPH